MQKPTPEALAAFAAAFPEDSRAEQRTMFGMPAGFINGNMFLGVFADGVVLRLPAPRLEELRALNGVGHFEPMHGRPWKEYVHVNAPTWGESTDLKSWALAALDHVATMPPKVPKPRKKKS